MDLLQTGQEIVAHQVLVGQGQFLLYTAIGLKKDIQIIDYLLHLLLKDLSILRNRDSLSQICFLFELLLVAHCLNLAYSVCEQTSFSSGTITLLIKLAQLSFVGGIGSNLVPLNLCLILFVLAVSLELFQGFLIDFSQLLFSMGKLAVFSFGAALV